MPLILTILSDFLKSTQPGIQAAEERVKFLALGESLVFRRTELIVSPFARRRSGLKYVPLAGFGPLRRESDGGTRGNRRAQRKTRQFLEGTVGR